MLSFEELAFNFFLLFFCFLFCFLFHFLFFSFLFLFVLYIFFLRPLQTAKWLLRPHQRMFCLPNRIE